MPKFVPDWDTDLPGVQYNSRLLHRLADPIRTVKGHVLLERDLSDATYIFTAAFLLAGSQESPSLYSAVQSFSDHASLE